MARQTLESWINEAVNDKDKDGSCTALGLIHMTGNTEKEIHLSKLGVGGSWTPKSLSEMFRSKAESYSQDLPGVQTFQILAFFGGRNEPQAFHPFTVSGRLEHGGLATEAPTPEGKLQQRMRHEEALIQGTFRERAMLLEQNNVVLGQALSLLKQTSDALLEARKESLDASQVVKEVMLGQAEQKTAAMVQIEKYKRDTAERAKWLGMAPALVNQLFGREIFPQSTADSALIDSIADSISPEQIEKIAAMGILRPEQLGMLASRMTKSLQAARTEESIILARGNEIEEDASEEDTH